MGTTAPELDFVGPVLPVGTGIIPRAVSDIFADLERARRNSGGRTTFETTVSFIELYNEDLLDLLADPSDARPLVQIREDKGHIIWSGLREVTVSSPADVMAYLTEGTAARQTSETDMNEASSRSHAIFSLTLTHRKYTGGSCSGTLTPSTPARGLQRPGSSLGGRATPSRQRFSMRSGSSMGHDEGECTTIVSKFHFVDLAGSERVCTHLPLPPHFRLLYLWRLHRY